MKMNRWNVTYTKHIKQKRKVYQDGILELSGDKVVLYDDCEKLITSRFLKKDEVVECGGMLAFETHLVDIGDPEPIQLTSADRSVGVADVILKETDGAHGEKPHKLVDEKSTLQRSNAVHGIIRENRKKTVKTEAYQKYFNSVASNITVKKQIEQCRGDALQRCPAESQLILNEWNALYTTQRTQKSKRYHDGILRVVSCGSHMNQVILLNEDGTVLGSKFLKSVDCLKSGCNYELSNYLVQICEPRTLLGDDSHGASLQQVAGCRSTESDKLMSNREATCSKSIPYDIQREHRGQLDHVGPADGRLINTNTKSIHEWNVLYTTQKTQKAKKYHDGILQLVDCGSHMKQVILLNEDGAVLSSKYLKSADCVKTGRTCEFPDYLVEIFVQRTSVGDDIPKRPLEAIGGPRSTCAGNFINASNDVMDKLMPKDFRKGHLEEVADGINSDNGMSAGPNNRPIRDAFQILTSLKRPVQIPQPSDVVLLDIEKNKKMPKVTVRNPIKDTHICADYFGGKTIVVDSDCQVKPASVEFSTSSNLPSGFYSRPIEDTCTDNISTSSSSSPEDHFNADKKEGLTDEIMALQHEWSALSYRVSAIGSMNNPISIVQNSIHADERHEVDCPSDTAAAVSEITDARREDSELQSITKNCLNEDEFPTFDLGFE